MYIIQNTSVDFPDGAQRFNWCSCQNGARKKLGLTGLGDTPLFDFAFWSSQLNGGGQATATPGAVSSYIGSSILPPAPALFGGSWVVPAVAVAGLVWYANRKGGRRK
jgi:hypothetical protein